MNNVAEHHQLFMDQQQRMLDRQQQVLQLMQQTATSTLSGSSASAISSRNASAGSQSASGYETASELITRLLHSHLSTSARARDQPSTSSNSPALTTSSGNTTDPARNLLSLNFGVACRQRAVAVIEKMWAEDTTWKNRANLWRRFQAWVERYPAQTADWAVVTFAESTMTAKAGRLQYAKDLVAMLARMGTQTPIARMYMSGLRSDGALIPEHQAYPISPEQVATALRLADEQRLLGFKAAFFIAWKTASRWSDVNRLVRCNVINPTAQRLTIYWGDATKSTRAEPFAVRGFVVVDHPAGMQWLVDYLNTLQPDQYVCNWPTDKATKWMHEAFPVADPMRQVTASSIKRGTVTFLVRAAARGLLSPELISRVAKHKHWFEDISPTTIRYVGEEVWEDLALCLRTQEATRHLP